MSSVLKKDNWMETTLHWNQYTYENMPNILKILPPKIVKFSDKNSDIFHISAQNVDCGYSLELPQGGSSNEYPESMFF